MNKIKKNQYNDLKHIRLNAMVDTINNFRYWDGVV